MKSNQPKKKKKKKGTQHQKQWRLRTCPRQTKVLFCSLPQSKTGKRQHVACSKHHATTNSFPHCSVSLCSSARLLASHHRAPPQPELVTATCCAWQQLLALLHAMAAITLFFLSALQPCPPPVCLSAEGECAFVCVCVCVCDGEGHSTRTHTRIRTLSPLLSPRFPPSRSTRH